MLFEGILQKKKNDLNYIYKIKGVDIYLEGHV